MAAKLVVARQLTRVPENMKKHAASSNEGQKAFQALIGLLEPTILCADDNQLLSEQDALLLATAISHKNYQKRLDNFKIGHPDPHFTNDCHEQWLGRLLTTLNLAVANPMGCVDWEADFNKCCDCPAHHSDKSSIKDLIEIEPPLNEDSGAVVAANLIQPLIDKTGTNAILHKCLSGTPFNSTYEVQSQEMASPVVFSGWPDHVLLHKQGTIRLSRVDRLIGVGETQSIPGYSSQAFMASVAQVGIYALGQAIGKKVPIVVMVVAKNLRVAVLVMSIKNDELTYSFVGDVDGFDLTIPQELQQLTKYLKAAIEWQGRESGHVREVLLIAAN